LPRFASDLVYLRCTTYATEPGEQRTIRLQTGSTSGMDSRSRVRIEFTDAERTVGSWTAGVFRVAKNPSRPFMS